MIGVTYALVPKTIILIRWHASVAAASLAERTSAGTLHHVCHGATICHGVSRCVSVTTAGRDDREAAGKQGSSREREIRLEAKEQGGGREEGSRDAQRCVVSWPMFRKNLRIDPVSACDSPCSVLTCPCTCPDNAPTVLATLCQLSGMPRA
eukprot:363264-Chlamydomonas_euryale.AAC.8